jgi:fatty-acyl-CoA synthase
MIISGGENIYPAEIENALSGHPAIADVAVVGVPDEKWGEAVCAVVAFAGAELSIDDIREHLTGELARYKLPSRLVVWPAIPRNGAGKLDKPTIRARVKETDAAGIAVADGAPFTENVHVPSRRDRKERAS